MSSSAETEAPRPPQRLKRLECIECDTCHSLVYPRFVASKETTDPAWRICYLKCPGCGRKMTRVTMKEVVKVKKRKVKYRLK